MPNTRKDMENNFVKKLNEYSKTFKIEEECEKVSGVTYDGLELLTNLRFPVVEGKVTGVKDLKNPSRFKK